MSVRGAHRRMRSLEALVRARVWGASRSIEVGRRVRVGRGCRLILDREARLVLGDRCTIDDQTTLAVYGSGRIVLGEDVFIGHHGTLAAHESIEIASGAYLAELVSVRDHDHATGVPPRLGQVSVEAVTIGVDCWLGAKVTVVRGARIGDRAVVGANAVVRGEVPADVIAAGVPAVVVRPLQP